MNNIFSGRRLTGLCGLIIVALTLPSFVLITPAPAIDATAYEIGRYYAANQARFLLFGWLTALSLPILVIYLAVVGHWLRQNFDRSPLWLVLIGSGVATACVQSVSLLFFQVTAYVAYSAPEVAKPISDGANLSFAFLSVIMIPLLSSGATVIMVTQVVRRWIGIGLLVCALLSIFGSLGMIERHGAFRAGHLAQASWYILYLIMFTFVNLGLLGSTPIMRTADRVKIAMIG